VSPVDGFASEGLHCPGHGPEGLLAGLREHAAVPDSIVEVTAAAMETVPSPHWTSAGNAAILATRTTKLAAVLVHLLSVTPSPRGTRLLLCRHDRVRVTRRPSALGNARSSGSTSWRSAVNSVSLDSSGVRIREPNIDRSFEATRDPEAQR